MRLKKGCRSVTAVVMALCLFVTSVSASAAAASVSIQPRFAAIVDMQVGLEFNWLGGANCTGRMELENDCTGDLTVTLQRSTNKLHWENVKTWTASGSGVVEINKTYYVESGYYYCVEVTVDVYNVAGTFVETATVCSSLVYH